MPSSSQRYPRMLSRRSFVAASIAATGAGAAAVLPAQHQGQFYPGARAENVDLSGFTRSQGNAVLRATFASFEQEALTITYEDRTWNASLADLGMAIDYESMLDQAWALGRDAGLTGRYAVLLDQAEDRNIPLILTRKAEVLDAYLADLAVEIAVPARDARLVRRGSEIQILADQTGSKLDIDQARADIQAAVQHPTPSEIALGTLDIPPDVTSSDLEGAKEDAVVLVSDPVVIELDEMSWELTSNDLTAALMIPKDGDAKLDTSTFTPILTNFADEARREPTNAVLGWDGGLYVVEDDQNGRETDIAELEELIAAAAATDDRTVEMPMKAIKAEVREDNLDTLGIDEIIAEGSSSFAGSSEARAENVRVASGHISNTLIAPDAQFSFNRNLGPISLDMGYVEGKIISGDWTANDLGGGVCQVSTTVFRAALRAGFKFEEWNPHSWRLAFYEADGSPPGMDAAIYQPNEAEEKTWEADLKFTNPLDSWLLLQMVVDGETATAQLCGAPLDYSVEIDPPKVSAPIKPPRKPVEKVNPKLRRGERKKVQNAAPGYKVELTRRILRDGQEIDSGVFPSHYEPQPEVWEVGPR
ncbi:MAG TPA: VanW family protein [Thermomicrobiales bacterium]|nr:VanW family protein [Thermomicrobiales bacterium]